MIAYQVSCPQLTVPIEAGRLLSVPSRFGPLHSRAWRAISQKSRGLQRKYLMVKNRKDSPENGSQTCSNMLAVFRREAHANFESLERNRVSNVSFTVASVGEVVILAIMVGILKGVHSDASTENNTKAFSILIAFAGGVWCE